MSKIARKLGRISTTKLDPDSHETSPSPSGEGEYGREDLVQSLNVGGGADGHTLQVPTPRMQHKQMKSMSTSHLENSYDGYVETHTHMQLHIIIWARLKCHE